MALPTNNSRPAIPYVPTQVLPNYDRYESLGQFPPTAQQLDGDLNKMIDLINTLSDEINHVVVGALPGADDPLNANSLMTTDGAGNISWVKAASANLDDGAVTTVKIQNAAITPEKIQPQAIDTDQLATNAVRTIKILDENVTTGKLANSSVTTPKIDDGAVTTPKISLGGVITEKLADLCVTIAKLANLSVITEKIADLAVTAAKLAANAVTTEKIAANAVTTAKIDTLLAQSLVPTGCVMPFAATNAPDGWIACTGVAVSRQTYAALFAVIGTTYGAGDGSTTFNVPDLRGRSMFGFIGSTNGLITTATADKVALGGKGGEETHVLTINEMPSHNHTFDTYSGSGTVFGASVIRGVIFSGGKQQTTNTGGGAAHTNMPPFILMNFIIKT